MNPPFDSGTRAPAEHPETGTDGLRQTYIPPEISYSEDLEVVAGICGGLKSNPSLCVDGPILS